VEILQELRERLESPENERRLALQAALNRREKIFSFNPWCWAAGLSVGDASSPVPGMPIREVASRLSRLDVDFARAVAERQLCLHVQAFDLAVSDVPMATQVWSNMGLGWLYRQGAFGEKYRVDSETGAFIALPVLESCADWARLPVPAFAVDEALHHERMAILDEVTGGGLPLLDDLIPLPPGSLFGDASRLRGDTDLLMDFRLCPEDVHALMQFLVRSMVSFNQEREKLLGQDQWSCAKRVGGASIAYVFSSIASIGGVPMYMAGEDHVSAAMFSEDDYLEFVFRYQADLLETRPCWYIHSCGNLTPFFRHIRKLPNVHRVHVSPWSSLEAAVAALGNSVILEVHQPLDFDARTDAEIDRMADRLVDLCGGTCTVDVVVPDSPNGRRLKSRVLARSGQGGHG
jgi:hypothetical protein